MPHNFGDLLAQQVADRIHAPVAARADVDAIPPDDRVDGMKVVVIADGSEWTYLYASVATTSATVREPTTGPGAWHLTSGQLGIAAFGDGSDGALAFDGSSVVLGLTPSSQIYTLARDIFATTITVASGVTIKTNGFRIFATGVATNTGTIHCNGNAGGVGSAGTGGTAGAITNASGALGAGTAGGAGGSGNNAGSAGTAHAVGFPGATGVGGAGGGDGTHSAAAAGTWAALAAGKGGARHLLALTTGMIFGAQTNATASLVSLFMGGTGGGGGGGDNADAGGGGGGGGGGVLILCCFALVNNGVISANGGAGGAGISAAHNAGGGGGGGGGVVITIARTSSGSGTTTATGGAGGAKAGASGVVGSAGTDGVVVSAAA